MSILSNEEKLDIFFNYLKELDKKDFSDLYRKGFNHSGLVVNALESELYIQRFKDDGLIKQESKESFIITLKGQSFKGYVYLARQNSTENKPKKHISKYIWAGIAGFMLIATFGMDAFNFIKENTNYFLNRNKTIESIPVDISIKTSSDSALQKPTKDSTISKKK